MAVFQIKMTSGTSKVSKDILVDFDIFDDDSNTHFFPALRL